MIKILDHVFKGVTREEALRSLMSSRARENRMMRDRDEACAKLRTLHDMLTKVEDESMQALLRQCGHAKVDEKDVNQSKRLARIVRIVRQAVKECG
jgi:hypothetical protein